MLDRLRLLVLHTFREFINWSNLLKRMSSTDGVCTRGCNSSNLKVGAVGSLQVFMPADAPSKIG